jgi:glycosyltransferase involved in cell wall biosynthesis
VLIPCLNAGTTLARTLSSVQSFDEVIVIDSRSRDHTRAIAGEHGARIVDFTWDGGYPKKKQWALDTVATRHDWVLQLDADEALTSGLVEEIAALFAGKGPDKHGYFITGRHVIDGHRLRFGKHNRKLCLFDKNAYCYPVVNDLDIPGMGEVEGHYQPVPRTRAGKVAMGHLRAPLYHYAFEDWRAWAFRHEKYARWEAGMIERDAFPEEPSALRAVLKRIYRRMPLRPECAFVWCYCIKLGFLDGRPGLRYARAQYRYLAMVRRLLRT